MTKEDKKLLLKDLCARLPYNVYAETINELGETHINRICSENINLVTSGWFKECKPYLRPMSSIASLISAKEWSSLVGIDLIDWYNANHIDYRGLIEKGLALEAPKDMYKIK